MGRRAQGWKLRRKSTGLYETRFTFDGQRFEIATGERDVAAAQQAAARLYADVVEGRWRPTPALGAARPALKELFAVWLVAYQAGKPGRSGEAYTIYANTHWLPFFERVERITEATLADYARARLRLVAKDTVRKELAGLRGFLRWLVEQGAIAQVPPMPALPRGATGTRARPKRQMPELSPGDIARLIAALPVAMTWKRDGRVSPVRAYFVVAYETSLRPATLAALSVPEHYTRGARELVVADDIDKARFGRTLPLTKAARAALDACAPPAGLIFGKRDYRSVLERARVQAGLPKIAPYDFRHARGTHLAEASGNLLGVAFLMGHKQVTTTNRYLKPTRRAADAVLDAANRSGAIVGTGPKAPRKTRRAKEGT